MALDWVVYATVWLFVFTFAPGLSCSCRFTFDLFAHLWPKQNIQLLWNPLFFLAVLSTKACEYSRFSLLLAAKDWRNVPGGEELGETTVFEGFGRPVTGDLGSTLVPEVKVETLHSGNGTVPEFQCGWWKNGCVHISAHKLAHSGTVPGYQVWTARISVIGFTTS